MRAVILLLAVVVPGCGSPDTHGTIPASQFDGFPRSYFEGTIAATAWFKRDHAETLRTDLIALHGVLPIWISVGMQDTATNDGQTQMLQESDMRLYLPDGTALATVNAAELLQDLVEDSDAVTRVKNRLFKPGPLVHLEMVAPRRVRGDNDGFVFFKLPKSSRMTMKGTEGRHTGGGLTKIFDLTNSLVSFNVNVGDNLQIVHVGVQ